jgi:DNA-binding sugar fermentation-stimulating protein
VKNFRDIPCLIQPGNPADGKRTTAGTVEAISLDGGGSWIGINQNRINGWVEQLLRINALPLLIPCDGAEIQHEVRVEKSRLDLCVTRNGKKTFLELKTPTHDLFLSSDAKFTPPSSPDYFARGIRHFETLARLATAGDRALIGICFMYDAVDFHPPVHPTKWNENVLRAVDFARKSGVEKWQINFAISPDELRVTKVLRLSPDG